MIITKPNLSERLRTFFAGKGLSKEALEKLTDIAYPMFTEESTVDEDKAYIESLTPFVGMLQAEVERVRTARVQNPNTKPEGEEKPGEQKNDNDETTAPAWFKVYADKIDKMDSDRVVGGRRSQLNEALEGLTETQMKPYSRMKLESYTDEEFTRELADITSEADAIRTENIQRGVVVSPPRMRGAKETTKEPNKEDKEAVLSSFSW